MQYRITHWIEGTPKRAAIVHPNPECRRLDVVVEASCDEFAADLAEHEYGRARYSIERRRSDADPWTAMYRPRPFG